MCVFVFCFRVFFVFVFFFLVSVRDKNQTEKHNHRLRKFAKKKQRKNHSRTYASTNHKKEHTRAKQIHKKQNKTGDEVCRTLLMHGGNVNATDKHGNTALMYACARSNDDVINILLQREWRIQIDKQNDFGWTALHFAYAATYHKNNHNLMKAREVIIDTLLKKSASTTIKNDDGMEPKQLDTTDTNNQNNIRNPLRNTDAPISFKYIHSHFFCFCFFETDLLFFAFFCLENTKKNVCRFVLGVYVFLFFCGIFSDLMEPPNKKQKTTTGKSNPVRQRLEFRSDDDDDTNNQKTNANNSRKRRVRVFLFFFVFFVLSVIFVMC